MHIGRGWERVLVDWHTLEACLETAVFLSVVRLYVHTYPTGQPCLPGVPNHGSNSDSSPMGICDSLYLALHTSQRAVRVRPAPCCCFTCTHTMSWQHSNDTRESGCYKAGC